MKLFSSPRKLQFSKEMCLRSWQIMGRTVAGCVAGEFALQWTGRGSMIAVVEIALALVALATAIVNGGYLAQNVIRDVSLNRNKLHLPPGGDKHYIEPPDLGGV